MVRIEDSRCAYTVVVGNMRDVKHVRDLAVDGMIILQWICKNRVQSANWNYLIPDRDTWLALVKMLMNFWVP
jgi:hypothetical protein